MPITAFNKLMLKIKLYICNGSYPLDLQLHMHPPTLNSGPSLIGHM